jgi:hypothetical protein
MIEKKTVGSSFLTAFQLKVKNESLDQAAVPACCTFGFMIVADQKLKENMPRVAFPIGTSPTRLPLEISFRSGPNPPGQTSWREIPVIPCPG